LWLGRPRETLAAEIISHVKSEPDSWVQTQSVAVAVVDSILQESGLLVRPGMAPVVYASSCDFLGHRVPHFVVMTEYGPVTVLVLMHERLHATERFESDGYRGMLVPVRGGTIAVVSHSDIAIEKTTSDVMRGFEVMSNRANSEGQ